MKIYRPVGFFMGFCAILLGIILYFRESNVQGFVLLGSLLVVGVPLIRWSFSNEQKRRDFMKIYRPVGFFMGFCAILLGIILYFRESNVQGFVLLGSLLVVGVPLIRWSFSDEAEQRAEKIKSEFQRISTPALILSQLCMFALAAFFCFVGNPDLVPIGIGLFLGLVIMMLVEMVLALYHSYREKHL